MAPRPARFQLPRLRRAPSPPQAWCDQWGGRLRCGLRFGSRGCAGSTSDAPRARPVSARRAARAASRTPPLGGRHGHAEQGSFANFGRARGWTVCVYATFPCGQLENLSLCLSALPPLCAARVALGASSMCGALYKLTPPRLLGSLGSWLGSAHSAGEHQEASKGVLLLSDEGDVPVLDKRGSTNHPHHLLYQQRSNNHDHRRS